MRPVMMSQCACDSPQANKDLLSVEAARDLALDLCTAISSSTLVPLQAALGRIAAKPLHAPSAMPFFDNSAMDGYAVCRSSFEGDGPWHLPLGPTIAAGDRPKCFEHFGVTTQALRIFTGAPVPEGYDAVVAQENCSAENGIVTFFEKPDPGANIRYAGSDTECGAILLSAGQRIEARHIGILAANGYGAINVLDAPRIAVFSTGDELVSYGEEAAPGQVYDCNKPILLALLAEMGISTVDDLGSLPDDQAATQRLLENCRSKYDFVLSTGSVSVGERDFLKAAFRAAGGFVRNWKVAVKPGKPVMFGKLGGVVFTGLPGNPFAAFVGFYLFVKPQILRLCGGSKQDPAPLTAVADFHWQRKPGRTEVFPVRRTGDDENGRFKIERLGNSVSATLFPLTSADGLAQVPADCEQIRPGDLVQWQRFCR